LREIMPGRTFREQRKAPVRLTLRCSSQTRTSVFMTKLGRTIPALFTSTSTGPAAMKAASTLAGSPTSTRTA
jgi:hypothetical protein